MKKDLAYLLVRIGEGELRRDMLAGLSGRLCAEVQQLAWAGGEIKETSETWGPDSRANMGGVVFLSGPTPECARVNTALFGYELALRSSRTVAHSTGSLPFDAVSSQFFHDKEITARLAAGGDADIAKDMLRRLGSDLTHYNFEAAIAVLPSSLHDETMMLLTNGQFSGQSKHTISVYKVANGKIHAIFPNQYSTRVSATHNSRDLLSSLDQLRGNIPYPSRFPGLDLEPAA